MTKELERRDVVDPRGVPEHVDVVLNTADPSVGFQRVAEIVADEVETDPEIRSSVNRITDWIADRQVDDETIALHNRLRRPGIGRNPIDGPDWTRDIVPVLYQRSLRAIERHPEEFTRNNIRNRLLRVDQTLANLEEDFIDELLIETERRAGTNAMFERRLDGARDDLLSEMEQVDFLVQSITAEASEDDDEYPSERSGQAAAQRRRAGGTICTINGEPADCTTVAIIVVIVVVGEVLAK